MIVAGLIGMLLTLALLRNADERVEVAVATHDLRTGDVVGTSDLRYERVKMDGDLLGTVLRRDDIVWLDGAIGRVGFLLETDPKISRCRNRTPRAPKTSGFDHVRR